MRGLAVLPQTMFTLPKFARELHAVLAPLAPGSGGLPPNGLCVALSGGLDSTVLLAALAQLLCARELRPSLRAVHVDHALHADSALWARACRETAAVWAVPLQEVRVDARALPGESPEAAARAARYAAFRALLGPDEVLLTAHHADDQLEPVLLQWLRGGGLKAVAGMAPLCRFEPAAWHARPLLGFARYDLETWARSQGFGWREDPSNADRRFDRNFLRHEILPVLRKRWPGAAVTAGRVAQFAREALALEAAVAAGDLATLAHGNALDLAALQVLPPARQRAVLRAWFAALALPVPSSRTLGALLHDATAAAGDRIPETRWPGAVVRRYRGRLYAEPDVAVDCNEGTWATPTAASHAWTATSCLALVPDEGRGIGKERLPASLVVTRRAGGERFVPGVGAQRRPLRKWLQEQDVLPWRRAQLPLLADPRGRLVAIADLACAAEFAARPGEPSWRVVWHGRGHVTERDVPGGKWPGHPPIG